MIFGKKKLLNELIEKNTQISEFNKIRTFMKDEIDAKNIKIKELERIIQDKDDMIKLKNNEIESKKCIIEEYKINLNAHKKQICSLTANSEQAIEDKFLQNVKDEVKKETREIFSLVHEQGNNLNSLLEMLFSIISYIGEDPFKDIPNITENFVIKVFSRPVQNLERSLDTIIKDLQLRFTSENIYKNLIDNFKRIQQKIKETNDSGITINTTRFKKISTSIKNYLRIENLKLNNEKRNNLYNKAHDLERLICLFDLHRVIDRIKNNIENSNSIINSCTISQNSEDSSINIVLQEVIDEYQDMASNRGIKLKSIIKDDDTMLHVSRKSLKKAISNILDNAIKYTGELSLDSIYDNTWIDIKMISNKKNVRIEFESWGIPVTEEEYKGQFMFKEGYRGRFARQADITGTGTGLSDVKKFAFEYGGDVQFITTPVNKNDGFSKKTKTTIVLTLPTNRRKSQKKYIDRS